MFEFLDKLSLLMPYNVYVSHMYTLKKETEQISFIHSRENLDMHRTQRPLFVDQPYFTKQAQVIHFKNTIVIGKQHPFLP